MVSILLGPENWGQSISLVQSITVAPAERRVSAADRVVTVTVGPGTTTVTYFNTAVTIVAS